MYPETRNEIAQCAEAKLFNPTTRERLLQRKRLFEEQLNAVNEAIQSLDLNPNIEECLNKIQKAGI